MNNNEFIDNGLKISDMLSTQAIEALDSLPIIQDSLNKKITIDQLADYLGIQKITSDISNDSKDTSASAYLTNQLNTDILNIKDDVDRLTGLSVNSDWLVSDSADPAYIKNKPTSLQGDKGDKGDDGNTPYIGINENWWIDGIDTGNPSKGANGRDGVDGRDGAPGEAGSPGLPGGSQYFHIRYSINQSGFPMQATPAKYIGTYVSEHPVAPSDYTLYTWYDWKGAQGQSGDQGIPGIPGSDGRTSYVHFKYGIGYDSNNVMQFTSNNGEDPGDWLGQYVDYTSVDSLNPNDYLWVNIKGSTGDHGAIVVFMGNYDVNTVYTGSILIRHAVYYSDGTTGKYYITKTTDGDFSGIPPTNVDYWEQFEAQYKSIATDLLLAQNANIAGWIFNYDANNNQILQSQAKVNSTSSDIEPVMILNGTEGIMTINGAYSQLKLQNTTYGSGSGSRPTLLMQQAPDGTSAQQTSNISMDPSGMYISNTRRVDPTKPYEMNIGIESSNISHNNQSPTQPYGIRVEGNNGLSTLGTIPGYTYKAGIFDVTVDLENDAEFRLRLTLTNLPTSAEAATGQVYADTDGTLKIKL